MKNKILEYLSSVELIHNITILYACESGSRMWNIACDDSDYDVRFIYYRQLEDYFSLDKKPEVIDSKNSNIIEEAKSYNIDVVGWDIRKYLDLFSKSNSTTFEWLESPIKYKVNDWFFSWLRTLRIEYFNHHKIFMSYYGLAQSNTQKYLCGKTVKTKKYLYSIRPILICAEIKPINAEEIIKGL